MLEHYVADAHMPLHCDARKFNDSIHGEMGNYWKSEIKNDYLLITDLAIKDKQFQLDDNGFPKEIALGPLLSALDADMANGKFVIGFDSKNTNVWDYMVDVLLFLSFIN